MEAALKAIAAPHRRRILRLVRDEELSAGEIASHFDVTRPAVSQHLSVLKEAGLVNERRNGTRRLYRARPEGLVELKAFLDELWGERVANPVAPGSSTIEIELGPEGAGTVLHFAHRDLPSSDAADSHAKGWDHYLERLAIAARGGDPRPDPWLSGEM